MTAENTEFDLKQAFQDLEVIRRTLARSQTESIDDAAVRTAQKTQLRMQVVGILVAGMIILFELLTNNGCTGSILLSAENANLALSGSLEVGIILLVLSITLRHMVTTSHPEQGEKQERFIKRNFSYLHNSSFFADLVLKYSIFSALIYARSPQLVGPLFTMFIGDYLMQGRFFVLPMGPSMLGGLSCVVIGFACLILQLPYIIYPAVLFALSGIASCFYLMRFPAMAESARSFKKSEVVSE
jgi:hypothetical protein